MNKVNDITWKLTKYLDQHMALTLFMFAVIKPIQYKANKTRLIINTLTTTNMAEFIADVHRELNGSAEAYVHVRQLKKEVIHIHEWLYDRTLPILHLLSLPGVFMKLKQNIGSKLQEVFHETWKETDFIYRLAKVQYECGDYDSAIKHLRKYNSLVPEKSFDDTFLTVLWGKLSASIMSQRWDVAWEEFARLKEVIDSKNFSTTPRMMTQRLWLMHWALYIHINQEEGRAGLIDFFFQDAYLNVIQTIGQHLLRYLTCAIILCKERRNVLHELIKVLLTVEYSYRDPLTSFIVCLYVRHDFDRSRDILRDCENIIAHDFFISAIKNKLISAAQASIFEAYCRLHPSIEINTIASKLGIKHLLAKRQIMILFSDSSLEAKINSYVFRISICNRWLSALNEIIKKIQLHATKAYVLNNQMLGLANIRSSRAL